MNKNIRRKTCSKLTGVIMMLVSILPFQSLQSQDLTSSPYSRFGIGDLMTQSTGRSLGMGSLGIGLNSPLSLNLINPAGLSSIDTISFLLEVGGFEKVTLMKTNEAQRVNNNLGFSYLALGFPVTKWWKASTGIIPYSGIGYSMTDTEEHPTIGSIQSNFSGSGGVSRFFFSSSISPIKYISLGATFSYLFGPLSHSKHLIFPSDSMYFSTNAEQTAILGDMHMSFGAQATIPLSNDYFVTLGGIYQMQSSIKSESRDLITTSGGSTPDTLYYETNLDNEVILPSSWGTGFTFGKKNLFTVGFDYRTANWSQAEFLGIKDNLANSREYVVGVEYIPNYQSLVRYVDRVRYRAGFHYGESYLNLKGSQLREFGINFGAGFPILDRNRRGTQSSMNVILELGKRGTVKNDLISESYGVFTLQFTLHDKWFRKNKYD